MHTNYAEAYRRDRQRKNYLELKRIQGEETSDWVIESLAEIEEEVRDARDEAPAVAPISEDERLDNRERAADSNSAR